MNEMYEYRRPRPEYTRTERWYALAAVVIGFFIVKTFFESCCATGFGLMSTVTAAAVTVFNRVFCRYFGMRGSRTTDVIFILTLLMSLSFTICDNGYVIGLSVFFIIIGNTYYSYASFREGHRSVLANAFRAAVVSPFYEYGSLFGAIFHKEPKKGSGDIKNSVPLIFGLAMSFPVCIAAGVLLTEADESFGKIFQLISSDFLFKITHAITDNILLLLISLPLSMYIFSAVFSRAYKMHHDGELEKLPRVDSRFLPSVTCAAFLAPPAVLYLLFVGLQTVHVFSASVLKTEGFSYAEYARHGFFELCAVAIINLTVISAVMFFCKDRVLSKMLRAIVITFCVLTHLLILTALFKMFLYIKNYGMTPKRVDTSIFMIYLFVMFGVLILKQFKHKISFTKIAYVGAASVLILMSFIPVDNLIVRSNILRYERGEIEWVGVDSFADLDSSAVPVIASHKNDGGIVGQDTTYYFSKYLGKGFSPFEMGVYDFNIPRYNSMKYYKN